MPFSGCYTVGRKRSFLNAAGTVETWEYQGGAFTAVGSWVQGGAGKLTELEQRGGVSGPFLVFKPGYMNNTGKPVSSTTRLHSSPISSPFDYILNDGYKVTSKLHFRVIDGMNITNLNGMSDLDYYTILTVGKNDDSIIKPTDKVFKQFSSGLYKRVVSIENNDTLYIDAYKKSILPEEYVQISHTIENSGGINPDDGSLLMTSTKTYMRYWFKITPSNKYNILIRTTTSERIGIYGFYQNDNRSSYIQETLVASTIGLKTYIQNFDNSTIPTTATYICVCVPAGDSSNLILLSESIFTKKIVVQNFSDLDMKLNIYESDLYGIYTKEKQTVALANTTAIHPTDGSLLAQEYASWKRDWFRIDPSKNYYFKSSITSNATDVSIYGFYASNSRTSYIDGTLVAQKSNTLINYDTKFFTIPIEAKYIAICHPQNIEIEFSEIIYEKKGVVPLTNELSGKVAELEAQSTIDVDKIQLLHVYDESTIKCTPYLFKMIGWNNYIPRVNFLMFPDFNGECDLLGKTCGWFTHDSLVNRAIQAVVSAGDTVTVAYSDKQDWINMATKVIENVNGFIKPFLFCVGNHDTGEDNFTKAKYDSGRTVSREDRHENWFLPLVNILKTRINAAHVHTDSSNVNSMYYYADIPDIVENAGVRFFALDESEYPIVFAEAGNLKYSMCATGYSGSSVNGGFNSYYSKKQLEFLLSALSDCPEDYLFVIMNHIDYRQSAGKGSLSGSRDAIRAIVKAYRENTSGSVTVDALENIERFTLSFDFSGKTRKHPVIHFHGHDHDLSYIQDVSMGDVWSIMNICGGTPSNRLKSAKSVMQYGADIVSIDYSNWKAYLLRFGYAPNLNLTKDADFRGFNKINEPMSL